MSDLVGNPEDRFSRVEAQIVIDMTNIKWRYMLMVSLINIVMTFSMISLLRFVKN